MSQKKVSISDTDNNDDDTGNYIQIEKQPVLNYLMKREYQWRKGVEEDQGSLHRS